MGWATSQGVQSLTQSTPVVQQSGTLTSGNNVSYGPFNISQTGYSLNFAWDTQAAGTASDTTEITMQWHDINTGALLMEEIYFLANPNQVVASLVGYGPTKGNQLTIIITNNDTATINYTVTASQNSRVYAKDVWQQAIFGAGYVGYTVAGGNNYSGILACESPSLASNGTATYIMPLWTGRIFVSGSSNNAWAVRIRTLDPNAATNPVILNMIGTAGTSLTEELTLPRSMCSVELVNTGSTTANVSVLIVMEYGE